METRAAELAIPKRQYSPEPSARPVRSKEIALRPIEIGIAPLPILMRYERGISIALIVLGLMTLSCISLQSLKLRIQARDTRVSIQNSHGEIGRLREDLQQAYKDLEALDALEGVGTLPIDPGDVPKVTLPPPTH